MVVDTTAAGTAATELALLQPVPFEEEDETTREADASSCREKTFIRMASKPEE